MVKQLKMLKTSVKFLCWFGAMLLIFGLVSLRRVITRVCAVGDLAYRARCVGNECGGTHQFNNFDMSISVDTVTESQFRTTSACQFHCETEQTNHFSFPHRTRRKGCRLMT
jgi:hypothetical protein